MLWDGWEILLEILICTLRFLDRLELGMAKQGVRRKSLKAGEFLCMVVRQAEHL